MEAAGIASVRTGLTIGGKNIDDHFVTTPTAIIENASGSRSREQSVSGLALDRSTRAGPVGWRQHAESLWTRVQADCRAHWRLRCPPCSASGCSTRVWNWELLRPVWQRVWLESLPYCMACLPPLLEQRLERCQRLTPLATGRSGHRIPLGLLLISRGWLTPAQLKTALGRQRRRGGKLGKALCDLGYTGEERIAAGLAMQWACPLLTLRKPVSGHDLRLVPRRLQELHGMVPVHYAEAARVLVLAFSGSIDYGLMQAIGSMLECRVEPCVATESQVRTALSTPPGLAREPEITFQRIPESGERSSIALSYIQHWGAHRVRVAGCGRAVWVRLQRPGQKAQELPQTLDLLFETPVQEAAAA